MCPCQKTNNAPLCLSDVASGVTVLILPPTKSLIICPHRGGPGYVPQLRPAIQDQGPINLTDKAQLVFEITCKIQPTLDSLCHLVPITHYKCVLLLVPRLFPLHENGLCLLNASLSCNAATHLSVSSEPIMESHSYFHQ